MRTLFIGGHIYAPSEPFATAMLIDGEHIAWIGSDAGGGVHEDLVDEVVTLAGDLLTPFFVDVGHDTPRLADGFGEAVPGHPPLPSDTDWKALPAGQPAVVHAEPGVPLRTLARSGVPLVLAVPTGAGPWQVLRDAVYGDPAEGLTARAAFNALTRAPRRLLGQPSGGTLTVGATADFSRWVAGKIVVETPDPRISNWSTDPRSATPGLPSLDPASSPPVCREVWRAGRPVYRQG